MPRYLPLQTGDQSARLVEFPVDIKRPGPAIGNAFIRARRALDRFREFENGEADVAGINQLVDQFFEAAEAIWHIRDWVSHLLDDKKADPELQKAMQHVTMRILRCAANASKHYELDKPDLHFSGAISLTVADPKHRDEETLSDIYRKLVLTYEEGSTAVNVHPTDFLIDAHNQFTRFYWNIGVSRYF